MQFAQEYTVSTVHCASASAAPGSVCCCCCFCALLGDNSCVVARPDDKTLKPASRRLQERYQEGVQKMLEQYFNGEAFDEKNYIVREGELAPQYK